MAAEAYPDLLELPSFVAQQRQQYESSELTTKSADLGLLQGRQLEAYTMLLWDHLLVAAPTGVAAFNVDGYTLHSLLSLPIKGDFKPLEGKRLQTIQQTLSGVDYIIIDEMSMVGRKTFGQVDRRLRQVFPARSKELFGGCSCLLFGDWGQLPPVMDLPLYTTVSRTELSDLGSANYHLFDRAVVLDRVMRQAGQDADQELFRDLLLRLRNGESSVGDWKQLMKRTPAEVGNVSSYDAALRLYPTLEAVAEYNAIKLRSNGQPVAMIKAVHTGPDASKGTHDDAGGLDPVDFLARGARVMLCANIWVEVGLVNGALGTVVAICVHWQLQKEVAGLLGRKVPFPDTADYQLLHHLQRITVVLETFHDVAVDGLESLGVWLGLGGILSTVVENPPARNNELHVNIRPPYRELQGVVGSAGGHFVDGYTLHQC